MHTPEHEAIIDVVAGEKSIDHLRPRSPQHAARMLIGGLFEMVMLTVEHFELFTAQLDRTPGGALTDASHELALGNLREQLTLRVPLTQQLREISQEVGGLLVFSEGTLTVIDECQVDIQNAQLVGNPYVAFQPEQILGIPPTD